MEKQEVTPMESIKTLEDALKVTGRNDVPEFNELAEDLRDYFKAQYEALIITEALVGVWKPDWNDRSQRKWFPWFRMSSGGFVFYDTYYDISFAIAGYASRLCFPTEEMAEYVGRTFTDVYSRIILK